MTWKAMLLVCLTASAAHADDTIIPLAQKDWKHFNANSETVEGALRVRIPTTGKKTWGTVGRYISGETQEHYLQIRLGNMESAAAAPFCSNTSTSGGRIGPLYSGLNTFKMPPHAAGRRFFLSLGMSGDRKAKFGPWVDFQEIRTTENPMNAPVVTLEKGDVVKVGSKLNITLHTADILKEAPCVRFCLTPRFLEYRFNKEKMIPLRRGSDGVYRAEVTVDKDALTFVSGKSKSRIAAVVKINGFNSYYVLPFPAAVETEHALDTTLADAGSLQVRDDRKLWLDRTQGVDLARGKRLTFSPAPDYRLTRSETDTTDLTRGRLTTRADDRVWFDSNAVGWYNSGRNDVLIKLDLGQAEPVEKVVIRLLGGTTGNFKFPRLLSAAVSKDGKLYHEAASMQKLAPCESTQADWKRYYFLEENASVPNTRMYPFELSVQADARYLILQVVGETGSVFSDALVCVKAEKRAENFNAAYRNPGREIPMEGLIIRPRVQELAVMKGVPAPQKFTVSDMRRDSERAQKAELVLELPEGVRVIGGKGESLPGGRTRYIYPLNPKKMVSPILYLDAPGEVRGKAVVYARSGGADQFRTTLPVRQVTPPAVEPFKRLHVSLSWMTENFAHGWPDFLHQWRKLGFNTVATFPRFWLNDTAVENGRRFVDAAHKAGYKTIMNDSAFHEMVRGKKAGHEIYCQIPGKTHTMLCPSYRGEFYRAEMERVRRCVREGRPDYVFYDIEIWHHAHTSAPLCKRCGAELRRSGKSLDDFLYEKGAEMMADLKQAVALGAKDANIPMPLIGSYARQPLRPKYGVERWETTYPASLDMAQPSLYVAGRALDVHNNIRGNHALLGNKNLIPWLTAGCYGEFDSYKMEQMVLEALLNGARGITYYSFDDFTDSPLDFYYHLKALAAIRPYEDLVMDGAVTEISGTNRDMTYSMLLKDGEALLLVGNYANSTPETSVRLPFKPGIVRDLHEGMGISAGQEFSFRVPRSGIRLFYLKKK